MKLESLGAFAALGLGGATVVMGANTVPIPSSTQTAVALTSAGVLADSDHAMFVGGTFEPTPSTAWVNSAVTNYLDPLGFAGPAASATSICDMSGTSVCDAPLQVLTTPELLEEGPSTAITTTDIVKGVEAEYAAGNMSASDPLTIFTYSQSSMAMSDAEAQLSAAGIPQADLRLVMIGNPSNPEGIAPNIYNDLVTLFGGGTSGTNTTNWLLNFVDEGQYAPAGTTYDGAALKGAGTENIVTPTNLYQTTVYNIDTDGVGDWQHDWDTAMKADNNNAWDALGTALYHFVTTHVEYLGLTPADVASGSTATDGLTTTITIPDGSDSGAVINDSSAWSTGLTDIMSCGGFWTSIQQTISDLFNPAYA